jgi:membrane protein implicated in regulation of membrane protease activity
MKQKLTLTVLILAALLGAAALWAGAASGKWVWNATVVASVLGLVLLAGVGGAWLRHRQHRRVQDMRDSALW